MSDLGSAGSEGRQAGASAHDGSMRACPLSERLGSGGRLSSFRQLAQSPKTSGVEDQGETTGGSGGRSAGEQGPPSKEARSSSCTITTNRQVGHIILCITVSILLLTSIVILHMCSAVEDLQCVLCCICNFFA